MCRAVLRSMYSSGLKPLTSPAIVVSKPVVSKCVIWPMPETPSIMFDQTVSRSLPIGVMKPMPVTATRRPLELFAMAQGYGRQGLSTLARDVKTGRLVRTRCPNQDLDELSEIQRQLQAQATRGAVEVAAEELAQLVQA